MLAARLSVAGRFPDTPNSNRALIIYDSFEFVFTQVILVVPDQKKGQFERLIAAGGGKVVEGRWVGSHQIKLQ